LKESCQSPFFVNFDSSGIIVLWLDEGLFIKTEVPFYKFSV